MIYFCSFESVNHDFKGNKNIQIVEEISYSNTSDAILLKTDALVQYATSLKPVRPYPLKIARKFTFFWNWDAY